MTRTYALADVTEASDNSNLASKHDIGSTLDAIDQGLAAAVVVVELGLRDRVVDVDGGDLQFAVTEHLVQMVDTGRGLLGQAADVGEVLRVLVVNESREIATVIENHVEGLVAREGSQGLLNAPLVLLLGLALPGEDRNARGCDAGV